MRLTLVIGGIALIAGLVLFIQFWPDSSTPAEIVVPPPVVSGNSQASLINPDASVEGPSATSTVARQGVSETIIEEPVVELPSLERSDDFLRERLAQWPIPEAWLQQEDLLSRLAVVVQNAADGRVPRRQLGFLTPAGSYPVLTVGDQFYVDPEGYGRYDVFVDCLEAMPAENLAGLIKLVKPLLGHAMVALGDSRSPDRLLSQALSQVQALPPISDEVELLRPNVMYVYADPKLEARSELDKQLMRMGPNNLSRLQSYLIDFDRYYSQY